VLALGLLSPRRRVGLARQGWAAGTSSASSNSSNPGGYDDAVAR